jgi:hypothetical protein
MQVVADFRFPRSDIRYGGELEIEQQMANHEVPRITGDGQMSLVAIERMLIRYRLPR